MAYEWFADVYDLFNQDADYDVLCTHVLEQLRQYGICDGIVADLGCGTGELTLRLAQAGYDMIGVDLSVEMLSVLREKAAEIETPDVLLLHQDIVNLDLYGTVRGIVSTFDTFNHITPQYFQDTLTRAALFLESGGVFLFDMNTPYKHEVVLGNNEFEIEAEDALCVWGNAYDAQKQRTSIEIEIVYDDGERVQEQFYEYVYTKEQIEQACAAASLRVVHVCDGEHFGALTPQSERFCFTTIKE